MIFPSPEGTGKYRVAARCGARGADRTRKLFPPPSGGRVRVGGESRNYSSPDPRNARSIFV